MCAYIRLFKEGWKYFCRFYLFVLLHEQTYIQWFLKIKNKNISQIFSNLQNHPTFHSEDMVGQLSKRMRVLCWSIYIIINKYLPYFSTLPPAYKPVHRSSASAHSRHQLNNTFRNMLKGQRPIKKLHRDNNMCRKTKKTCSAVI